MIFRFIVVLALVAAPALGSAIKGHAAREETKGGLKAPLSPIEQQRLVEATKSSAPKLEHIVQTEQKEEQQQIIAEEKREPLQQQKEEVRYEEAKGQRYEAKVQLSRDELAKGQKYEQQREEQQQLDKTSRYEQKQEEKIEQLSQQREYDAQQIELREELPLVQPIQPLATVEEINREQITQQQVLAGTKGGNYGAAPLGMAEPYAFNYQVEGSSRSESGDVNGVVRGQYTLQNADGSSRVVDYVADHNGFRASVNTNEFGTEAKSPANVALRSSQPNAEDITLKLEGKTKEDLAPPAAVKAPAVPAKPENWAYKGAAPQTEIKGPKRIEEAPVKGQRLIQETQQQEYHQEPTKSAELRAPKALGEAKLASQTRGFESATAHHAYRAQPIRPAPAVAVRVQPTSSVVRAAPAVSRTYLQRERYPPSPVQAGRPRVSFYNPSPAAASFDDEQPVYEQPDS